jgi:hypothetical protein
MLKILVFLVICRVTVMLVYLSGGLNLTYNGTAIEGVCVTGEAIRPVVPVASKERVPVASRYGAVFAIMVREGFITIAVQGDSY